MEFTILDSKLFKEELVVKEDPIPHLFHCTPYTDAVAPPFPGDGKKGLSIFVGRLEQFRKVEVPLLWNLDKSRGRHRMVVITNLRGKGFVPAFRNIQNHLSDSQIAPISFLRRRGKEWDSLDFFSSGESPSMEGAAPRLKRLKQRGWETVVDRLALGDTDLKQQYFEELTVERQQLQEAFLRGFSERRVSPMIGVAGQCLQKEHLSLLLQEDMIQRLLQAAHESTGYAGATPGWTFLGKRKGAGELILMAEGNIDLEESDVMVGDGKPAKERNSEFLISKILQKKNFRCSDSDFTLVRVKVEWRYPPSREIPVSWRQNSTRSAGSEAIHG